MMENHTVVLIVLSSILLILVIGLIFKKDFREDVLKAENDNEAEFKGFKIKGALFWVLYAATAFGTIFLAMNQKEVLLEAHNCTPLLSSIGSDNWIPFDIENQKGAHLKYGCSDSTEQKDFSQKNLGDLDLSLNNKYQIISPKSNFVFGTLDKDSLENLGFFNDLKFLQLFEIKYDLKLNPWEEPTRNAFKDWDWNKYESLSFKIAVKYSTERNMHAVITNKAEVELIDPLTIGGNKWEVFINIDNKYYLIRLKSQDTNTEVGGPYFAIFQIVEFSGEIL